MKKLFSLGVVLLMIGMTAMTLSGSQGQKWKRSGEMTASGTALSERGGWLGSKRKAQTGKFTGLTALGCLSTRATATCRFR